MTRAAVTLAFAALCVLDLAPCLDAAKQPNIVLVLLDDAGWGDFQTNDAAMATPNIHKLAQEGLILNNSYILPMCAPSRTALITGRYPHTMGAQTGKAAGTDKIFWPGVYNKDNVRFVSEELRDLGYRTHALGKWHLGFCHPSLTPLGRGFDTFHGMMLGAHSSYYTHIKGSVYDWYNGVEVDETAKGKYNTELVNQELKKIVEESDPDTPFFVYGAYPAPHGPFEAPQRYVDQYCSKVKDKNRRMHCAMVAAVDEGVGMLVKALKAKGTYDNTVILVMSDNGGPVGEDSGSSNWPLRGGKKTVYEGGTRVFSVLKAPGLKKTNTVYNGVIHAVDWMQVFVEMAGGKSDKATHGEKDTWSNIKSLKPNRKEMLYTYDDYPKFNHWAYRVGDLKLIHGKPGFDPGWYPPQDLIDAGLAERTDDKTNYEGRYQLYDLSVDPNERNDLAAILEDPKADKKEKDKAKKMVKKVKDKYKKFMKKYKLIPHTESKKNDAWKNNGFLNLCWCQPKNTSSCDATLEEIKNRH